MFGTNTKTKAERFLQQHNLGQTFFTDSPEVSPFPYLRKHGYLTSKQVSANRWASKIVKNPFQDLK